jgi:NitT/TauT family transport system ATP-binding protein
MINAASAKLHSGEMVLKDVHKSFGPKRVVDGISLTIRQGSFTCLCGPSGCGKTTIMNMLAGYLMPDRGECLFNGDKVSGPSTDRLVVFQETTLFMWQTLWENTLFGPKVQGKNLKAATEKAHELIKMSGLSGFENKFPRQLSGGMQRRAELIRVLINEPNILLLDEPFRGLDAMTRGMMQEHFIHIFEKTGTTMVLITSELEEAIFMGDTVYLLTAIPTRVKKEMIIDLPRPRTFEHQTSMRFAQLQEEAYATMEEEALKTFELVPEKPPKS